MKKILLMVLVMTMFSVLNAMADNNSGTPSNNDAAQSASITGKIIDKTTGEPLAGVTVKIEGTNLEVYTDFDGNFTFKNIAPSIINLKVSLVSYKENVLKDISIPANQTSVLEIALDN